MATAEEFELGLLPERKMDWRTLVTSYGFEVLLLVFLINVGLIWPDRLQLAQKYHVTELVPMPSLRHKPLEIKHKAPVLRAKLLPPAPVLTTPKLTVPREVRSAGEAAGSCGPKSDCEHLSGSASDSDRWWRAPGATGADWRIRQFRSSDHQCPDPESADRWLWRSQWRKGRGKENAHLMVAKLGSV